MSEVLTLVAFPAVVALAAFGVGYELADPGAATTVFLLMAVGALLLTVVAAASGMPGWWLGAAFAAPAALIAAGSAYLGGKVRER
jgi:hypothetical protein